MLKGQDVVVHTDHQNLTYDSAKHNSDCVLWKQLLLEEYGVQLRYIKGKTNVVADALLQLLYKEKRDNKAVKEWFLQQRVFEDIDLNDVLGSVFKLEVRFVSRRSVAAATPGFEAAHICGLFS